MALEKRLEVTKTARYFSTSDEFHSAKDLWVVLHGYGQLASGFLGKFEEWATPERIFIAPEGLHRFYTNAEHSKVGASWMSRESRETDIEDNIRFLDQLVAHLNISPSVKVHLLGFSQGAATAVRWFCTSRLGFASLTLWAGSFPPDVSISFHSEKFSSLPVLLVSGKNDQVVAPAVMKSVFEQLEAAGVKPGLIVYDGDHVISSRDFGRVLQLLESGINS